MQSQNNTVISLSGQEITDAAGNSWSIVDGQVTINGVVDPTTANVTELAYENGLIWQKNTDNLWWSKSSPDAQWSPTYGTSVDPIPDQHASVNDTVLVAAPSGTILDANVNEWTIVNGVVVVNGVPDTTTARVVQLVYSGGEVWQENADGLWWAKSSPTGSWNPPLGTTQAPVPDSSALTNTVTLSSQTGPIMDASGNQWAIVNGQVTLNGVADPTTRNVTELAYINGNIWQENADGLWWSKTTPADPWNPPLGTSRSPVPSSVKIWGGEDASFATGTDWTPAGAPHSGDTAIITSGRVTVDAGYGAGVNFDLQGGGSLTFNSGTFDIGALRGSGFVQLSNVPSPSNLVTTGIQMSADNLEVAEFVIGGSRYSFVVSGASSISNGSVLNIAENGTASLPLGTMENDGAMTVSGSTLRVGGLTGSGSVILTNNASVTVQYSAASSETIKLQSGHLYVGGLPGFPGSTAMQFLSPVTQFGASSDITLGDTQATQEVFSRTGANAGEMLLYNGSTLVADLHLSGQHQFYASNQSTGGGPNAVLITAYDTGHSIPVVNHVS